MKRALSSRTAWAISIALTLFISARLIHVIATTHQGFDADEAVHAVESLRRYDDLARGHWAAFWRDCYFPERWQPPVQDHLRWYPIVHSLSQLVSFALFGLSDFSARLPSIVWLAGACLLFHALAKRIAPRHGDLAGVLAVFLLIASPNVITFTPQTLIEACCLFWAALALYAYVRFVEQPQMRGRAVFAGACLTGALLTKYDHGLLQMVCLAAAELLRQRLRIVAVVRSHALLVFGIPAVVFALWLAHPDKWQAFRDALSHPAYGSGPVIVLNFGASWLLEYTTSPLVAAAALYAPYWVLRRERGEGLRAVAVYAALAMVLLAVRARFQFRYAIVEAPMALLLVASLAPTWIERWTEWYRDASETKSRRIGLVLAVIGLAGTGMIVALALAPVAVARASTAVLQPVFASIAPALKLSRGAGDYAEELVRGAQAALAYGGWTFVATPIALLVIAATLLVGSLRQRWQAGSAAWFAAVLAVVPGALYFHSPGEFSRRLAWEYECIPALSDIVGFIDQNTPERARILFANGWDQLPNNAVAWYLKTQRVPRPNYEQLEVVGDMIGSLVQPSEPRIRQWAEVLAKDGGSRLPDRVVLIEPGDRFRYRIQSSPEVAIYRAVIAARGGYRQLAVRTFDAVGCQVEILAREDSVPAPLENVPALDLLDAPRAVVGEHGWVVKDDAWRHLRDPARSGAP